MAFIYSVSGFDPMGICLLRKWYFEYFENFLHSEIFQKTTIFERQRRGRYRWPKLEGRKIKTKLPKTITMDYYMSIRHSHILGRDYCTKYSFDLRSINDAARVWNMAPVEIKN